MTWIGKRAAWLAAAAAIGVGACTSLLGDDFQIVAGATGGGGSGAAGEGGDASGGAADGGGGSGGTVEPGKPLNCVWDSPTGHTLLATTEGLVEQLGDRIGAVEFNSGVRVFTHRYGSSGGSALWVHTIDGSGNQNEATYPASDLHQALRLPNNRVAALISDFEQPTPPDQVRVLKMLVVDDNDFQGQGANVQDLSQGNLWTVPPMQGFDFRAAFVPAGPDAVDFFVGFTDASSQNSEAWGRASGGPVDPVVITKPGVNPGENDVRVGSMVHHEGTTHVFAGDVGSDLGLRQYVLDASVSGPIDARSIDPSAGMIGGTLTDGKMNVAAARFGATAATLFLGKVDAADLDTFTFEDDLFEVDLVEMDGTEIDVTDLPVDRSQIAWLGDLLFFIGGLPVQPPNPPEIGYFILDVNGFVLALDGLPFEEQVPAGVVRDKLEGVAFAPDEDFVAFLGGDLHVAWIETRYRNGDPSDTWQELYYDRLDCLVR